MAHQKLEDGAQTVGKYPAIAPPPPGGSGTELPPGTASFSENVKLMGCIPWGLLGMTVNEEELAVDNHVGFCGIKLCSQQVSTRVTTDKINFIESQVGSRSPTTFFLILLVSAILIIQDVVVLGIVVLVVGMLLWWFLNDSKVTFGVHNLTFNDAPFFSTSVLHNQSGIWFSKLGSGTDGGSAADKFVEESTEAMYASHGLKYAKGTKPDGEVYKLGSYNMGCIKSGSHDILFCNQHIDCVETEGLFAIPAVSKVLRTRFFAKDVRFTHQHKPGRSVPLLIFLMGTLFVLFQLAFDTFGDDAQWWVGGIGAVLGAVFWWFNVQPWIMFHVGSQGKTKTMQTPFSSVPKIQERLDTLVFGRPPSKGTIDKYGVKEKGKGAMEYLLEITPDQLIVTDKAPGFCGLQACSTYDKWIAPLKDIDYAHAEISSSPILFWMGLLLFVLFMIPFPGLGQGPQGERSDENLYIGLSFLLSGIGGFLKSRMGAIEVGVLPAGDRALGVHTTSFYIPFKADITTTTSGVCKTIIDAHKKARKDAGNQSRELGAA